ncbi:Centromere-associated protein NUF2 [Monocercomonoides exilis]|uniref:Centromere-associated protein NUF2 n=1 Tax=Monocercomonoides exilis TaxID=2049356 RepID=UPI00355A769A|nr:Centromere-associated protein NUF2 [Monocercomonoides exilis]|eukprot:MONOS_9467.1-p1 / transcript=MONOS_9467.1 / gene=MONOS_9467 / organism=Monocercomonoides_exilis_PA203 / gene_product=Centromere-associated protein NUF2 / transcript_product=Centromere-associated protein NUF2 / location=Mono_scaffold00392:34308-36202(-) / protein_length=439 / sequence_SO=supercontig / SO=protein_coding / is_pseudo=false
MSQPTKSSGKGNKIPNPQYLLARLREFNISVSDEAFSKPNLQDMMKIYTGFLKEFSSDENMIDGSAEFEEAQGEKSYLVSGKEKLKLFIKILNMMKTIGFEGFSLKDIFIVPDSKTMSVITSRLVEYSIFRNEQLEILEKEKQDYDAEFDEHATLEQTKANLVSEIEAIRIQQANELPNQDELNQKLISLQAEFQQKNQDMHRMQTLRSEVKAQYVHVQTELTKLNSDLKTKEEEKQLLQSRIVESPEQYPMRIEQYKKDLEEHRRKKIAADSESLLIQTQIKHLTQMKKELDELRIKDALTQHQTLTKYRTALFSIQDKLRSSLRELQEMEPDIFFLKQKMIQLNDQYRNSKEEHNHRMEEIRTEIIKCDQATQAIREGIALNAEMQMQIANLKKTVAKKKEQLIQLNTECDEKKQRLLGSVKEYMKKIQTEISAES